MTTLRCTHLGRLACAAAAAWLIASPAAAQVSVCEELWALRNGVYKEAGYCFKTRRAIQGFGNAGCRYDELADVPLSARDRAKVADLVAQERVNRCPR